MVKPSQCLWGKDFFDTYLQHAKKTSYNNEILHNVAALSLIGQPLRNVRLRADQTFIDCRVNPFIVQSSGTGKNSAFNFMSTVAGKAGIKFSEHGKDSTAGIMGTVQRNGEVQKGDLAGSGFVAWKEAQQLVKAAQSDHSSDMIEVINQALDPSGKVSRALSGGKLQYHSRSSLFCTTYPPEPDGQIDLIHQGFLPRMLFLYRRLDEEFYDGVNEKRDANLPRGDDNQESYIMDYEEDVQKLANTLKYIEDTVWNYGEVYRGEDSAYAVGREHIDYFQKVEDGAHIDPTDTLNDVMSEYPMRVRKKVKPFKTRLFDTTYKLAACLAAVDKDEENDVYVSRVIRKRHTKQAKKIIKHSWRCILEFVQDYSSTPNNPRLSEMERTIKEVCMNDSGYATVRELMVETNSRKSEVRDRVATLEEMNKIKTVETHAQSLDPDDKVTLDTESDITRY